MLEGAAKTRALAVAWLAVMMVTGFYSYNGRCPNPVPNSRNSRTLLESFWLYIHTVSDEGAKELADPVPVKICLVSALQLYVQLHEQRL